MSSFREYAEYDALGLAELVANKDVHPKELVEAAIARIERLNPALNAVIMELYDSARKAAESPPTKGPFAGVPYLLKDMVAHAGTPLTFGSAFMKRVGFVPKQSHEVVRRTEEAGVIVVAKTNACELGLLPITEPEAYGPTANPWNLDHSPGGSSGGSAAAVAAGFVPAAHANDGGGSIRIPASACGIFGLKPSRGRNPGLAEESADGITVEHCVSRSVRDSAALLDVTRGPLPGDRWWAPPPKRNYLEDVTKDPKRLTIAFSSSDYAGRAAHPECVAAVEDAAKLCEDLGHRVVEASPNIPIDRVNEAFAHVWTSMATSIFLIVLREARSNRVLDLAVRAVGEGSLLSVLTKIFSKSPIGPFERWTRKAAAMGAKLTHAEVSLAMVELQKASSELGRFLSVHDCYLTPTLSKPPVLTGSFGGNSYDDLKEQLLAYAAFTPPCNYSGVPAMSVPLYWSSDGLPVGVHFMGRFGDESTLFRLAGQLERARPWFSRLPPMAQDS